jgi:hypothetical protein
MKFDPKKHEAIITWLGENPWFPIVAAARVFYKGEMAGEQEGIKEQILAEELFSDGKEIAKGAK